MHVSELGCFLKAKYLKYREAVYIIYLIRTIEIDMPQRAGTV